MLSLAPKLPLYWAFRRFGWPRMYPFSGVVSISFRCNSKCRTCDVWRKPNDDMTVEEWDKVFANLGRRFADVIRHMQEIAFGDLDRRLAELG